MRTAIVLLSILLSYHNTFAQGCSDAGVCSSGSMNTVSTDSTLTSILVGQSFEMGERFMFITSTNIQLNVRLSPSTLISAKSNYMFAWGDLGHSSGFGDVSLNLTQRLFRKEKLSVYLSLGGKIPANTSNFKDAQNRPLPMPYQSSLGTFDIYGGASVYLKKWRFSIGYQHSFNSNKNEFLYSQWDSDPEALRYYESAQLTRGDDLMLRIERLFIKNKNTFSVSALPILRLQKDRIIKDGNSLALAGSDQLTLNLNFTWVRQITEHLNFRLTYGSPVIWRKNRADGLTRFFVINTQMQYKF